MPKAKTRERATHCVMRGLFEPAGFVGELFLSVHDCPRTFGRLCDDGELRQELPKVTHIGAVSPSVILSEREDLVERDG